jgi:CheY-like chemotaxis protein
MAPGSTTVTDNARKILLIDDSEITLTVMKQLLVDAGFDVRAVGSLRQFLNALLDWRPHLIVTDLYMPEMSGAELCTWIRQQVDTARTPIVLCSSAPAAKLEEVAKSVGADAYLSKEEGIGELPGRLQKLCDEIVW